jgi:hypothetical protein
MASDGKTHRSHRVLALERFTIALGTHLRMPAEEKQSFGPDYRDHEVLFCWPDGRSIHPDTITEHFNRLVDRAGLHPIILQQCATPPPRCRFAPELNPRS